MNTYYTTITFQIYDYQNGVGNFLEQITENTMKDDNINWRETSMIALSIFMLFLGLFIMGAMLNSAIKGEFLEVAFGLPTIASSVFCISCAIAYKCKGELLTVEDDLSFKKYFQGLTS